MLKITLVKSTIAHLPEQKKNVKAFGLGILHSSVIKNDTPQIRGMIEKVKHLVTVEEVE